VTSPYKIERAVLNHGTAFAAETEHNLLHSALQSGWREFRICQLQCWLRVHRKFQYPSGTTSSCMVQQRLSRLPFSLITATKELCQNFRLPLL
jgi:hypothetical protein